MKNNFIKTFGLILFLVGFGIFNASFFLGEYKLTNTVLENQVSDSEKREVLSEKAGGVLNTPQHSVFGFVSSLDRIFSEVNKQQLENYGFEETDIENILSDYSSAQTLTVDLAKSLENIPEDEFKEYKVSKFLDYGSWLDGRTYEKLEDLERDVRKACGDVNKYSVINEKGFDKYTIKYLLYSLTKASDQGLVAANPQLFVLLTYVLCIIGASLYILPRANDIPGIKNNHLFQRAMTSTGWLGIMTGAFLIAFYVFLYYYPEYMTSWIIMVDPISVFLKGSEAGRFFLYGYIYTLCILVMGFRMILKYWHSKYQVIRTISVMFFQTAFAFLIPEILLRLNKPYFDFKNIWPLDYDFFFDNELSTLVESGSLGIFMLVWGIALVLIAVPVFVYFFGKRWYCSWVCGCGGLAETLGDPYRQLSDKSLKAWKVERWMIHGVLVFAVVMTAAVLYTYFTGDSQILGLSSYKIRETYGAWIGAGFAGVVGTGFYPLMGNRVWCRFGCPLAAYLGLVQKFKSRFRITTNGGQCISCGNCSTYCEMGIDVRWYAQRGQNIIRSSCVGCGVCSSVCPRGVLNLEVKDEEGRYNEPILIGMDHIEVKS